MTEAVLFYLFSLVAVIAGVGVVTARSPITSALSLVVCFFFLAANYALLDAHFVAVVQVLVYTGAIMVLFIFVIMLLNLRADGPAPVLELSRRALLGITAAGVLGVGLVTAVSAFSHPPASLPEGFGTIAGVGSALFAGPYLLPFEVVSLLLTVAVIGAVILAKKEL